jgi:2-polyprenyl-6-methoxyphenol hydroxylase-like FAD-dependent oxidoreductase
LEVFDDLGVIDAIKAGGAPFPPFRLYSGAEIQWERSLEEMLRVPQLPASPGVPYRRPWLIPQWRTDRILHDRFVALGGRVDMGTELTGLTQDADGVTAALVCNGASESVRTRYLIGADGGRSFVRNASGVRFEGETYETERTLIGDVRVSGLEGRACHILADAGDVTQRFSLWNLPDSNYYQFVANVSADAIPDFTLTEIQALLDRRSGRTDIRLHDLRWISLYRVNVRMADHFRIGRIFLAGDAAHVHSSAGGQGLNTSVQDAYNLGWKLAAVLDGARSALLDSYEEERLPVAAQLLGLTTKLHKGNFRPANSPTPGIHQLDISYRGRSLAVDDRSNPGELRAGDRAPDAPVSDGIRLFDVLRGPHFTLLAFGGATVSSDVRLRVLRVGTLEGYDVRDGDFVLVRPDGYIAAITSSLETIHRVMSNFFCVR